MQATCLGSLWQENPARNFSGAQLALTGRTIDWLLSRYWRGVIP
jgi:hypothetical protein